MFLAAMHGFVLALGLILPLGAQNLFVFNQGIVNRKLRDALIVCGTASLCDTLLISAAVLGVSLIVLKLVWLKTLLIAGGVLFLLYVGWTTWRSAPDGAAESFSGSRSRLAVYTAMLSLLNPHAILDTVGVIGTSSLQYEGVSKLAFALTCILVSWIWFFSLAAGGRLIGQRIRSVRLLTFFNKCSACIMWGAAAYLIVTNVTL